MRTGARCASGILDTKGAGGMHRPDEQDVAKMLRNSTPPCEDEARMRTSPISGSVARAQATDPPDLMPTPDSARALVPNDRVLRAWWLRR